MNQKTVMEWQWCQCVGFDVTIMLAQQKCLAETVRGGKIYFCLQFQRDFSPSQRQGRVAQSVVVGV